MRLKDKNKPFSLSHITLYAKGWYKITDDVVKDLLHILRLDDYSPQTLNDVCSIMIHRYEETIDVSLSDFTISIQEYDCWKVGYYTKGNSNHSEKIYDYRIAIIHKILSDLRFCENNQWKIKFPKYSKGNERPKNITIKRLIQQFL